MSPTIQHPPRPLLLNTNFRATTGSINTNSPIKIKYDIDNFSGKNTIRLDPKVYQKVSMTSPFMKQKGLDSNNNFGETGAINLQRKTLP